MSQSKKAVKSVYIIVIFSLISKILGFLRETLIASKFGSGTETDTFFIALTAISLFSGIFTGAINTTMIPVLSEVEAVENKKGKKKHTNNLLNIVFLISFIIIMLTWIFAPLIIKILASGFEGEQFKSAILMFRIGLPTIFFAGVVGVFRGYLQSELMFTESAAAQFPVNLVYIFYLIFLSGVFGMKGLMIASVVGVAAQIIIQVPGIRSTGFRYKYILDFKDKYVKKVISLIPPILVSIAVSDLNKIVDRSLASTLVDGSISALNYASRLDGLTTGIFISAITTVIFPLLSQEANKDTLDGFKKVIINGINIILLITIPATVGMIILANPVVKIAFERGAFDSTATNMTVGALIFYSIGLVGTALKPLLSRAYYSLQDTKAPMVNSFIAVGINIILNFILISFMAHKGLALATSISAIVTSLLLLYGLKKRLGSFGFIKSIKCGLKSLVAALVMGVAVYLLDGMLAIKMGSGTLSELIALLVSAGVGVLIYFILIYLFRVEEAGWTIKAFKRKLKKSKN